MLKKTLAIYEGLKHITQLVQVKMNVISHHQGLISTMRRTETMFIYSRSKRSIQNKQLVIEEYLEYEKSIQKYEETAIITNAEFISNWGITLAEFDENKLKNIHNFKLEEVCMKACENSTTPMELFTINDLQPNLEVLQMRT